MNNFLTQTYTYLVPDTPGPCNRTRNMGLVTFILLGIIGACYWFMISDQENYLVKRNFRLLSLWSQEITQKTESYKTVFELAYNEFHDLGVINQLTDDSSRKSRLLHQPRKSIRVSSVVGAIFDPFQVRLRIQIESYDLDLFHGV